MKKQVGRNWIQTNVVVLLAVGFMPAARAATDPFLLLSSPSVVSDKVQFTISGEVGVDYVVESSKDCLNWTPVATNSDVNITRLVTLEKPPDAVFYRAWRQRLPVFAAAVVAGTRISFGGTNITLDSYDSEDPAHSTNGLYYAPTRLAGGDIACAGAIDVGNARINGKIRTGTNAAISLGTNAFAGPIEWTGPGICPGWLRADFRFVSPDVSPPSTNTLLPAVIFGTPYKYVLSSGGYIINGDLQLGTGESILIDGVATLYVSGNIQMSGLGEIIIVPNASLKLYVAGPTTVLTKVNNSGPATAFQYYGLPTNKSIAWVLNDPNACGTVYAPQVSFVIGGGGSETYHFQGAWVVDSLGLNGHFSFHYDEALKRSGPKR